MGVHREGFEVALRIEHDEAGPLGTFENAPQRVRVVGAPLERRHVGRRRHVVDAVLPELDDLGEGAFGPAVLEVSLAGAGHPQGEHAVDDALVVQTDDQHRQVLPQRPDVDRQIGGQRRLAHAALVGRDRDDRTGDGIGVGGARGVRHVDVKCTHRVG
jgi:hypothetical protein